MEEEGKEVVAAWTAQPPQQQVWAEQRLTFQLLSKRCSGLATSSRHHAALA